MTDTHRPDEPGPAGTHAVSDAGPPGSGANELPPHPPDPAPGPGDGHRPADEQPTYQTGGLRGALLVGALVAAGIVWGWPLVAIILGVVLMIFLHELGHYLTAKWSGMKVTEFFIGFGPRIWSFRRGETEYGVKVLPAGAYVRIIGMNNLDEADPADEPRTYRQQSFPKRLLVVSAGSLMHMAQAFVLLVILLGVTGVPGGSVSDRSVQERNWAVGDVVEDSAAGRAGLEPGDRIVAFNGDPVETWDDVTSEIKASEVGDEISLGVERGGESLTLDATLGPRPADQDGETGSPFLGVGASWPAKSIGLGSAIVEAPGEMAGFMGDAVVAMAGFFSPDGLSDFADNVGEARDARRGAPSGDGSSAQSTSDGDDNRMISIVGFLNVANQSSQEGWVPVLFLFFQINVFIGILNMIPLPPLDGGHAAVAIYERIRSRRGRRYTVDMAKLLPLTYAVLLGLIMLGGAAIYLDIVNPIDI